MDRIQEAALLPGDGCLCAGHEGWPLHPSLGMEPRRLRPAGIRERAKSLQPSLDSLRPRNSEPWVPHLVSLKISFRVILFVHDEKMPQELLFLFCMFPSICSTKAQQRICVSLCKSANKDFLLLILWTLFTWPPWPFTESLLGTWPYSCWRQYMWQVIETKPAVRTDHFTIWEPW